MNFVTNMMLILFFQKTGDLLEFWNATPFVPAELTITIDNYLVVPMAQVCFNELQLPCQLTSYDAFRNTFTVALLGRQGYGKM